MASEQQLFCTLHMCKKFTHNNDDDDDVVVDDLDVQEPLNDHHYLVDYQHYSYEDEPASCRISKLYNPKI